MLKVVLGYNQGAKISDLIMRFYSKDTATKMELMALSDTNGEHQRKKKQISRIVWSIALEYFPSDQLLLDGIFLKIVLELQKYIFVLISDDARTIMCLTCSAV